METNHINSYHSNDPSKLNTAEVVNRFAEVFGKDFANRLNYAIDDGYIKPISYSGGVHYSKQQVEDYLKHKPSKAQSKEADTAAERQKFWQNVGNYGIKHHPDDIK
jgi:hypothetical protein